ncbi:hypothetical protein [Streptomyces sp. NPDC001415]
MDEVEAQGFVEALFVLGACGRQGRGDVVELFDQVADLGFGEHAAAGGGGFAELALGGGFLGLGLVDPVPFGNWSLLVGPRICTR